MSGRLKNYAGMTLPLVVMAGIFIAGCGVSNSGTEDIPVVSTPVTVTTVSFEPMAEYIELTPFLLFRKKVSYVRPLPELFLQ